MTTKTTPIKKEEEIASHPDAKIDQDFPGFPHHPSTKKNITTKPIPEKKAPLPKKTKPFATAKK